MSSDVSSTPTQDDRVIVFDTTLRDGEQSPGYSMSATQKIEMAQALAALNVDIIEAGFAAASPGDFESVQQVAREVRDPVICSLSRATMDDIRSAGRALSQARRSRIHIFLATSPIHREFKLQMTREQVLTAAVAAVREASEWVHEVEFSPEDGLRTERDFLCEVIEAVIQAGVHTVNIPDTVGYTTPAEIRDLFHHIKTTVPGADQVVLSTHCHNDLGMAVANSLAALEGGARQIECTINGIGERAGNCSLEEAVMALKVRQSYFHLDTAVDTTGLYKASTLLCALTGNPLARNKPVVGRNAFAHEAGIHQHGVLANKATYEIMKPSDIGIPDSSLVLGKHSGKHALKARAEALGYRLEDNELKSLFVAFKALADTLKEVTDSDLEALILGHQAGTRDTWHLVRTRVTCDSDTCTASVEMEDTAGQRWQEQATGTRPEDAVLAAIAAMTGQAMTLGSLTVRSSEAQGAGDPCAAEAEVLCAGEIMTCSGTGANVLDASARAFATAANRIALRSKSHQPSQAAMA